MSLVTAGTHALERLLEHDMEIAPTATADLTTNWKGMYLSD